MSEEENILRWWETVPTSAKGKKVISVNLLEEMAEVGRCTFQHFFKGRRALPQQHLDTLIRLLEPLGYTPLSNDHRFL